MKKGSERRVKRLDKWTFEDYLLLACIVVFVLIVLLFATGCTVHTRAQDIDIIWHDGKCLLVADGMNIEQARELKQAWNFKECDITVTDE